MVGLQITTKIPVTPRLRSAQGKAQVTNFKCCSEFVGHFDAGFANRVIEPAFTFRMVRNGTSTASVG